MTKYVEIMNADCGTNFKPVVQVWDKGYIKNEFEQWVESGKDNLIEEFVLENPFDLRRLYITSSRYLVIKEQNND